MKTATTRKNGAFGYKAVVRYADGSTHIPVRKNFPSADAARAYAQKWIDANDAPRDYAAVNARKDAEWKETLLASSET